ncbi:MAG: hypothetical protein ACR2QM_16430, partial [Longimicrobiales bacterium]
IHWSWKFERIRRTGDSNSDCCKEIKDYLTDELAPWANQAHSAICKIEADLVAGGGAWTADANALCETGGGDPTPPPSNPPDF